MSSDFATPHAIGAVNDQRPTNACWQYAWSSLRTTSTGPYHREE